jgi:hypothetical protein
MSHIDGTAIAKSAMLTGSERAEIARRNRVVGLAIAAVVALVVLGGAIYVVYYANNAPPPPALPAGPPHSTLLSRTTKTDIVEGNFILDTALYTSTAAPAQVIAYYHKLLATRLNQIGRFAEHADTILPAQAPEALQHVPPIFAEVGVGDGNVANYFYTQYSFAQSDVGVAIDARHPTGPTLVYLEMLTLPNG